VLVVVVTLIGTTYLARNGDWPEARGFVAGVPIGIALIYSSARRILRPRHTPADPSTSES
jgi:hypothetical protein